MKVLKRFWPILFIILVVAAYFWRLFFPEPKLFYTVETLGSDLWSFYYPNKDFLSHSLKSGTLPFWSKDVGTGLPLFAGGQIGSLYLPNLVLYFLFPTWLAWNLNYILAFFLVFLGSFLFFQKLGNSKAASLFSAFSFSFGGFLVSRIIHTSPLQTISLMPWIFLYGQMFWEKPSAKRALLVAFVISQQIFSGGYQFVFISLFGFFLFSLFQFREKNGKELVKKFGLFSIVVMFGLLFAAPQILPIIELTSLSTRSGGLSDEDVFVFPYPLKYLITFLIPDYYGTPRDGTFSFDPQLGLYWENTAYLGLLPILFMLNSLFSSRRRRWEWSFLILGVLSLLFALGRASPLYFFLKLPGFSSFRVPSRFLALTTFSMAALAGTGFDRVIHFFSRKEKHKAVGILISLLILILAIADLFHFGYLYHPLVSIGEALNPPATIQGTNPGERIFTHQSQVAIWKETFFSRGWEQPSRFIYLKNGMYADLNLIFGRTNVGSSSDFLTEREFVQKTLAGEMKDVLGVKYVISPSEIQDENLVLLAVNGTSQTDLMRYFTYINENRLERFRFVSDYTIVGSLDESKNIIEKHEYPFVTSVLLEADPGESFEELGLANIEVLEDGDEHLTLSTISDKKAILVLADSFYPGWKATINNIETEIFPANINQRAVIVPPGDNIIEFYYVARSFLWGVVILVVSIIIFLFFSLLHR
ncbi:MAG: hypothetical protein A2785_01230 [Candidatus Chisholmbacteria bacterium RIFCSPHIGHO2_01_FULL_49_18]|uniref:Membrane protein 6-pyruvoyl-tetrahydropterin synthase-related domain-containing protein n=1 Tax=Candidatus Chisholmbacteria bacterium RIFCSPHIGHO2_01_FULL_49_18 TaxID=1797590 RepID=A0A1G1VM42_9BACT|nr:MAG: hypothetical protein A2785_01230 [Candidatus Chisholmbacteria bacterium RIFCSPHIGHO2_01_FULL_49_18]